MREQQGATVREARAAGKRKDMATAITEPGTAIQWAQHGKGIVVATIAAFVMALVGAFGTDQADFGPRLAYWLIIMESGALIGMGMSTLVIGWGRLKSRPIAEGVLIALGLSLPLTFIVFAASAMFFEMPTPSLLAFAALAGAVFTISLCMTAINYHVTGRAARQTADAMPPPPDNNARPAARVSIENADRPGAALARFAERLPLPHRHASLLAIEAEDHYLRVHTDAGSTLILMRLGDAIADLADVPGIRTHRSWWVARDAIRAITRGEGRAELTLGNAASVPVSRTHYRALQQQPWFRSL
jgi:LytTr DNA-binding domain